MDLNVFIDFLALVCDFVVTIVVTPASLAPIKHVWSYVTFRPRYDVPPSVAEGL